VHILSNNKEAAVAFIGRPVFANGENRKKLRSAYEVVVYV